VSVTASKRSGVFGLSLGAATDSPLPAVAGRRYSHKMMVGGEGSKAVDVQATRIVVFLSEDDRVGHQGLHEALLERAREDGMAGATVWRAVEGFGWSGHLRTARFPDAWTGLPLAVEVIDTPERIETFVSVVKHLAPGAFVTRESVQTSRHDPHPSPAPDDPGPRSTGRHG
jgi:uncharacterized protein